LNLPDNLGAKKKDYGGSSNVNLNDEIINDMKKKNLLSRLNNKLQAGEQLS
jgi:hypothetical protein